MSSGTTSLKRHRQALHASLHGPDWQPAPPVVAPAENRVGRAAWYRRSLPAWLWSLAIHLAALLVCLPLTFATLSNNRLALWASPSSPVDETLELPAEFEVEPTDFEPREVEQASFAAPLLEGAALSPSSTVEIVASAIPVGPSAASTLPGDVGTLMSTGEGSKPGGGSDGSSFFGTQSPGNRFVFVIDNSRSMKGGRLEAAVEELLRSVGEMSRRQAFYVIFVSDQTYPMFYPEPARELLPATAANKERLTEWVRRVQKPYGKNRELVTAMQLAASLRPDAVFFLWDGRIDDLGVRQEVMRQLTRPHESTFPIHTIGMGVDLPDSAPDNEQNLIEVARAHGGTYRRVDVP